ncbi:MAG: DEAD/DEAH box helicase [Planctomycetaceae bacterium]
MSPDYSQNSAVSGTPYSPFDTFEMPTSGFVLDLPPMPVTVHENSAQPVMMVAGATVLPAKVENVAVETVADEAVAVATVADEAVAVATVTADESVGDDATDESFLEIDPVMVHPKPVVSAPVVVEAPVSERADDEQPVMSSKATEPTAGRAPELPALPTDVVRESASVARVTIVKVPVGKTAAATSPAASPAAVVATRPVAKEDAPPPPKPVVEDSAVPNTAISETISETVRADGADPLFRDLPLSDEVQKAVLMSGYDRPTAIQAQIIPHMLEGRDVLAQSQTGTGKTAAFALPILSRLNMDQRKPQVLVLAPTRELAIQVANSFSTYGAHVAGFAVAAIYGGQDYDTQFRQLKRGVQVVVGTPGRVIDHINKGTLDLSEIRCLALDEADEMLNMGFLEDVQFVLERTPPGRQVALFSATLPPPIRAIAQEYLNDPVRITIKQKTMTAESIRQRALFVAPRDKIDVLTRFLEVEETDGVIVFTKTRDATVTVAEQLCQHGLSAIALNGDMPQKIRERTIQQLKAGHLDILVATDVAARGLDVTRVSHVFNFDVPHDSESYIHRIGRTGRAGRKGEAIIFLSNSQRHKLRVIERATRQPIEVVQVPTADEINAFRMKRFERQITETIGTQDVTVFERLIRKYADESGQSLTSIAAALAHISQGGRPFLMTERSSRRRFEEREHSGAFSERSQQRSNDDRGPRGRDEFRQLGAPEPGMDRYRIEVGRKDGVKPGNIVGAVANEGGIDGSQIGPIRIHDSFSTIDLPEGMPRDIFQTLQQTVVAGRPLRLRKEPAAGGHSAAAGHSDHRRRRFSSGHANHPGKHKKRKFGAKHGRQG